MGENAWKIGRHELRIEPPDIVFVRVAGDVTKSDAIGLLTLSERCSAERDYQFWLVEVRELGHIHPGARRQSGSWPLSTKHWGIVSFGVGFTQRLFARLLLGAAKVLRGEVETVVGVSQEEEARAWISEERMRRLSAAPPI